MNTRFRTGFLQMLYFIPGIQRCCCINAYTRDRSTSLRTGIALTGIANFNTIFEQRFLIVMRSEMNVNYNWPSQ